MYQEVTKAEIPSRKPGVPDGPGRAPVRPSERMSLIASSRAYWPWLVTPVLLAVVLAIAIGFIRSPTYSAEARLVVGGTTSNTSLTQSVLGNQTLASIYARIITADSVTTRVAAELDVGIDEATDALSATPIPESPIIRVEATADNESASVELANVASAALVDAVAEQGRDTAQLDRLLRQVSRAEQDARDAEVLRNRSQDRFDASPTPANERRLTVTEGNLRAAELEARALSEAYQEALLQRTGVTSLEVLNPARSASSDRASTMQTLVIVALLGGLVIGIALSAARAALAGRS